MIKLSSTVSLLATIAMANYAVAQKITLDYYFNHQVRTTKAGTVERYHYTWDDKTNSGYSIFGDAFKRAGATLDTLGTAPTITNLKGTAIYIIVNPNTKKKNPDPKYILPDNIIQIAAWVKSGGVLLMLANDSANVELPHFNKLAAVFGMHFNDDLQNHVQDDKHFDDGAINTSGNPAFATARKIFIKDACSIGLTNGAQVFLKNANGAVVMATTKYGKGTVLAVGDPWLYNEYTNGRLPVGFDNDRAASDIVAWLLKQSL